MDGWLFWRVVIMLPLSAAAMIFAVRGMMAQRRARLRAQGYSDGESG